MPEINIVKIRDSGGNASVTIPRHIIRATSWAIGAQLVAVDYDEATNRLIITPITLQQIKEKVKE